MCGGFVETEATMPSQDTSINSAGEPAALVRIERSNGVVFAIFTDPNHPGFEYDPSIHSAQQAQKSHATLLTSDGSLRRTWSSSQH
ncbi:hypothetical protein SNK04_014306 [Fusarium graminearum]